MKEYVEYMKEYVENVKNMKKYFRTCEYTPPPPLITSHSGIEFLDVVNMNEI